MVKKSYFYVFVEDPWERDKVVKDTFVMFSGIHQYDSTVKIFTPSDSDFEETRKDFEIRKLPAFAIADEPKGFSYKSVDPFVSFERGVIELYPSKEELYRLISDIHYILIDEYLLRVNRKLTETRLSSFFRIIWDEVKEVITIRVPA